MVLMGMRKGERQHAPVRLHASEGMGWRMNERKTGVVEDA